jgi:hypothetical protein
VHDLAEENSARVDTQPFRPSLDAQRTVEFEREESRLSGVHGVLVVDDLAIYSTSDASFKFPNSLHPEDTVFRGAVNNVG